MQLHRFSASGFRLIIAGLFSAFLFLSCSEGLKSTTTGISAPGSMKPFDVSRINGRDIPTDATEVLYITRVPTLEWEPVEQADRYVVFIQRLSDGLEVCQDVSKLAYLELAGCFLDQGVVYRADVRAIGAGTTNSSSSKRRPLFSLDSVKPAVVWSQVMPANSNLINISFAFSAVESGSGLNRFECRLDSGVYSACTSPFTSAGLAEGSHSLFIRAYDVAGNSSVPLVHSWVVDTTNPTVPTVTSPSANTSVAASQYVFVWNSSDLGSGLSTSSPFELELYSAANCGGVPIVVTTSTPSYPWSGLSSGQTYSLKVKSTDRAGNSSQSACSANVTSTGGSVSLTLADQSSASQIFSNSRDVDVTVLAPVGSTKWCVTEDAIGPISAAVCPGGQGPSGGWHTSTPTAFQLSTGDGLKNVRVWVVDSGGALDPQSGFANIILDEQAPAVFTISGVTGALDLVSDGWLVGGLSPVITFAGTTDSSSGLSGYRAVIRNQTDTSDVCAPILSSGTTISFSGCTLADAQSYLVKVVAIDLAGNERTATNNAFAFTVDNPMLGTFSVSGVSGGADVTADGLLSALTDPVVHFTSAAAATTYDVVIRNQSGTTQICARLNQPASPVSMAGASCALADNQTYMVFMTAKSASGQVMTPATTTFSFVVDSILPGGFSISGVRGGTDATVDTVLTDDVQPIVQFTPSAGATDYFVRIRNQTNTATLCEKIVSVSPADFSGSSCGLIEGTSYLVTAQARSLTGANSALATNSPFSFQKNTSYPVISFQSAASLAFDQSQSWPVAFDSWSYRTVITIDNALYGETFNQFPVAVRLNPSRINYSLTKAAGADLRFTDASDVAIPFEIETWNPNGESVIWVRIPTIVANSTTTTFKMYFGNSGAADGQSPTQVWSDGYRAVYHMKDFLDSASNAYHATSAESAISNLGAIGSARTLAGGVQSSLRLPTGAFDNADSTYTVEMYFRTITSSAGIFSIVNAVYPAALSSWLNLLYVDSAGRLRQGYFHGVVQTQQFGLVNDGQWRYLTQTLNGLNSTTYLNGASVGSMTLANVPLYGSADIPVLGTGRGNSWPSFGEEARPFSGQIDEVRISSTVRSPTYIAAQYRSMSSTNYLSFGPQERRGTDPVVIQVQLDRVPTANVDVPFTLSGSAVNPADHNLSAGTLSIPSGTPTGPISFQVFRNAGTPGDKTLVIELGAPTGGILGTPTQHTLTIKDNVEWPRFSGTVATDAQGVANSTTTTPDLTIQFSGGGSVIIQRDYRIIEELTGLVIVPWSSIPGVQPFQLSGLALTPGVTYVLQARALDSSSQVFGPYEIQRWRVRAPAVSLAFSRQPTESFLVGGLAGAPMVELRDAFGQSVTSGPDATAGVVVSLSSGSGALLGTTTTSLAGGVLDLAALNLRFTEDGIKTLRVIKQSTLGAGGTPQMIIDSNAFTIRAFPCDSGTWTTTCVVSTYRELPQGVTIRGNNLTIENNVAIRHNFNLISMTVVLTGNLWLKGGAQIQGNVDLTANEILMDQYARINADNMGYVGGRTGSLNGTGPGGGIYRNISGSFSGGGGAYGGRGSAGNLSGANGGSVYGSAASSSVDFGSGGGAGNAGSAHNGGNGGGRLRITAAKLIQGLYSYIHANGGGGGGAGGGGSGGGVYLNITDMTESSWAGYVQAVGGNGGGFATDSGGSGGGGRIVIHSSKFMNGQPQYYGGTNFNVGERGTFHFVASAGANAICDTGTVDTLCEVTKSKFIPEGSVISGTGTLSLKYGASLWNNIPLQSFSVLFPSGTILFEQYAAIDGNVTITAANLTTTHDSYIRANGVGHPGGGWGTPWHPFGGTATHGKGAGGAQSVNSGANIGGGGGSYGGLGSDSDALGGTAGATYGSITNPQDFGSGGGSGYVWWSGGGGGGKIDLTVTNLTLNGESFIQAYGSNAGGHAGGGSGGTIRIQATNVSQPAGGWAHVQAIGGDGSWWTTSWIPEGRFGGAGGGGRVYIDTPKAAGLQPEVYGGRSLFRAGQSGSYHLTWTSDINNVCDSGTLNTTCVISQGKFIPGGMNLTGTGNLNFIVNSGGTGGFFNHTPGDEVQINLSGNLTMNDYYNFIHLNLNPLSVQNLTLPGSITADRLGHVGGFQHGAPFNSPSVAQGPGAGVGVDLAGSRNGGGGAHGSNGVNGNLAGANGGTAYGSNTNPTTFGSGGGSVDSSRPGANGGGLIRIIANTISGSGRIYSNGADGSGTAGGGAGGSIHITANTVSADYIIARGAVGNVEFGNSGGAGGGGRVALFLQRPPNAKVDAWGGRGFSTVTANSGTYYLSASLGADAICDTGSLATTCTVSSGYHLPNGYLISGAGNLVVDSNGCLANQIPKETISINMTGSVDLQGWCGITANVQNLTANSVTVGGSSRIDASGLGFVGGLASGFQAGTVTSSTGEGNGGGANETGSQTGGGGGYGGAGGSGSGGASGGIPYSTASNPLEFGSGGGSSLGGSAGGPGGGTIRITTNTLLNNGTMRVNGGNPNYAGGGGSGGSININTGTISGTGTLEARGGEGFQYNSTYGGSGGGGRIRVTRSGGSAWPVGQTNVQAGPAAQPARVGSAGTTSLP